MSKYLAVGRIAFANIVAYRLNFFIDQLRNVIILATLYFLWQAVFSYQTSLFGFTQSQIFQYLLLIQLLRSLILQTNTGAMAGEIADGGNFFSYLLRPVSYLGYWFSVDLVYKLIDFTFTLVMVLLFGQVTGITLVMPSQWWQLVGVLFIIAIAIGLQFLLRTALSFIAFWTMDVWAPRFLFEMVFGFAAGYYFPLDVLPNWLQTFLYATPFPYLLYFPTNMLLGKGSQQQLVTGIGIMALWTFLALLLTRFLWLKGLKVYEGGGT